ncbi:hypothetical protein [Streptomyces sp. NPDC086023]|uniref:hypothetical protein n=1 Tax=Streptomyces sp. NPDC086023 TaxID=3365746 RepID=UPI0037D1DAB0
MITAGTSVASRARSSAAPLRLLWLALLLFGFLYTHAAGADSASAHALGTPVTPPSLTDVEPRTGDPAPSFAEARAYGADRPRPLTAAEPYAGHGHGHAPGRWRDGGGEPAEEGARVHVPAPAGQDDPGHSPAPIGHGHGDGGGHSHPAEACDAGHTQHGGEPGPPGRAPLGGPASPEGGAATRAAGGDRALPPLRSSVGSVVQRV